MNAEQFIREQITKDCIADSFLKATYTDAAILKYRRNQFESVSKLICDYRRLLTIQTDLEKGTTAREYSIKHRVSYDTALRYLKYNACARYKGQHGAWVYRG